MTEPEFVAAIEDIRLMHAEVAAEYRAQLAMLRAELARLEHLVDAVLREPDGPRPRAPRLN